MTSVSSAVTWGCKNNSENLQDPVSRIKEAESIQKSHLCLYPLAGVFQFLYWAAIRTTKFFFFPILCIMKTIIVLNKCIGPLFTRSLNFPDIVIMQFVKINFWWFCGLLLLTCRNYEYPYNRALLRSVPLSVHMLWHVCSSAPHRFRRVFLLLEGLWQKAVSALED